MPARLQFSLRTLCLMVLAAALVAGFVIRPLALAAMKEQEFNQRKGRMRQVALAIAQYESTYRVYPPCAITGPDGRHWHSWRVLIAAQLDPSFASNYRFNEPWDSPHNSQFVDKPPELFANPNPNASGITPYLMVCGKGFFGEPDLARRVGEILDGTTRTIGVIEHRRSDVKWTEPRDFDFTLASAQSGLALQAVTGEESTIVGFVDGHYATWHFEDNIRILRAYCTVAGMETCCPGLYD